jgi:hypothetical protein
MSANFGDRSRAQGNRPDAEAEISAIEGLTKADLFIENNSLQKALKFMESQLEEKMSKFLEAKLRPNPSDGGRPNSAKTKKHRGQNTIHQLGEEVLAEQDCL